MEFRHVEEHSDHLNKFRECMGMQSAEIHVRRNMPNYFGGH